MRQLTVLSAEEFAFRLDREYQRKKAAETARGRVYGLRTLARGIALRAIPAADNEPAEVTHLRARTVESLRKNLQRYLRGEHLARRQIRVALALELGCDPEIFGVDTAVASRDENAVESDDDDPEPDDDMTQHLIQRIRAMRRQLAELEQIATQRSPA